MGERIKDEESSHVSPDKKVMDLCARLKEEIVRCRAEYELKKSDSFEGTVLHARLEMLQTQYDCLEKGEKPEALSDKLQKMQRELREARDAEEGHSTFDWYDEYYYYKVYTGQIEACRIVTDLLKEVL